jgi:hypothetical protein
VKESKERKTDRVVLLKAEEKPKGLVDPRLFTGENKLHVIQTDNGLWYFKYEHGGLPEPLKQQFTSFDLALKHAERYFQTRGIKILGYID